MNEFSKYLTAQLPKFGNKKGAMAAAIGMSATRLSRAINHGDYPFDVANCLRLARAAGADASEVLRAAGKSDVAELLEGLYGPSDLTGDQRAVLTVWADVPVELRPRVLGLIEGVGQSFGELPPRVTANESLAEPAPKRRRVTRRR